MVWGNTIPNSPGSADNAAELAEGRSGVFVRSTGPSGGILPDPGTLLRENERQTPQVLRVREAYLGRGVQPEACPVRTPRQRGEEGQAHPTRRLCPREVRRSDEEADETGGGRVGPGQGSSKERPSAPPTSAIDRRLDVLRRRGGSRAALPPAVGDESESGVAGAGRRPADGRAAGRGAAGRDDEVAADGREGECGGPACRTSNVRA